MTFLEKLQTLGSITDMNELWKASHIIPDENLREALVYVCFSYNTTYKSDGKLIHEYAEEITQLKERIQELEQQIQELS